MVGLEHIYYEGVKLITPKSLSHTVGSEPAYKASKLQKRQGRHPTQWARN